LKIVVLGGGRMGHAIARDLSTDEDLSVTVVDLDPMALERLNDLPVKTAPADLSDQDNVARVVAGADLVVGALPGFLGYRVLEAVLEEGRPVVDISFAPEDTLELDDLARSAGVPCLVDCGLAPGLTNLILGRLEEALDETHSFRCLVGSLPVERDWPWEYKAPFSPRDVIQEYVRPARLRRGGEEVTLPALSEVELVHFPGLGTLEAFNTDGLRTLLRTSRTPNMVEKTMRYPGHAERMRVLRDGGFFSDNPVQVESGSVRPRDLTEALLFEAWHFAEGEPDLTVARVAVDGVAGGEAVRHTFNLLDYYNPDTETSSLARTTGYTCTAMARLVARGIWKEPGVAPAEVVGRNEECFQFVLRHLEERDVHLFHREEALGSPTR
jgi:saccharopine dehydrogenase-like NADP-dependent oxidoreductase